MKKNITKTKLFCILILGLLLRIWHLGKENFWIDEIFTVEGLSESILTLVKYWFSAGHVPIYFISLHYWMQLFGITEFAVRFPSLICDVVSIYIVFILGRKLFDEKSGLLASYLFAVSTINIYYSQCAKPYSMTTLFTLLSFLFLLKVLDKNTMLFWISYIFFTLFALFSSPSALPVIICQIIFIIVSWPRYKKYIRIRKLIFVFSIILFIYLPLLLILVLMSLNDNKLATLAWLQKPSIKQLLDIFNLFGVMINQDIKVSNPTRNPNLVLPTNIFGFFLFLLCLVGIFDLFKSGKIYNDKKQSISGLFLSLWLSIPIVLPFVISYFFIPIFGPVRYILYTSAPYYLLVSKGIFLFRKKLQFLLIGSIAIMGFISLQEYYHIEKRANWSKICGYIQKNIKNDEITAFINSKRPRYKSREGGMLSYYSRLPIIRIRTEENKNILRSEPCSEVLRLIKYKWHDEEDLNFKGLWIVTMNSCDSDLAILRKKYILVEEKVFYDVTLRHLRAKE